MPRDRRAAKRYVVDGLLLDIGGIDHETLDVSPRSVAVIRRTGVEYGKLRAPFLFKSSKSAGLRHEFTKLKVVRERAATLVFDYVATRADWEDVLKRHDVRADVTPLEDVFG